MESYCSLQDGFYSEAGSLRGSDQTGSVGRVLGLELRRVSKRGTDPLRRLGGRRSGLGPAEMAVFVSFTQSYHYKEKKRVRRVFPRCPPPPTYETQI